MLTTTMKTIKKSVLVYLLSAMSLFPGRAQTKVDINLDVKHTVGGISTFDRQKYITLHSSLQEGDWTRETDKMNYVFKDLNVYLGRDNGGVNYWLGQSSEDKNRAGFADSSYLERTGANNRATWAASTKNVYDNKSDVMIGGQVNAMWPGQKSGWTLAGANSVGEYMAHYVNDFFRSINNNNPANGHPAPRFLEVLNEPEYNLHDDPNIPADKKVDYIDIFRFHRDVAKSFKKLNTTTKIGGYTVAFPEFDLNNFKDWDDKMKMFIDTAGRDMDFYSIHLYDFNRHWVTGNKGHIHFKGSRTEATLDMLEAYSMLKDGVVKPLVISEYGGRDHSLEGQTWSPERDWIFMKAFSPLLMQFMDRPNSIVKTIPFIMAKATWSATPDPWRLMRQNSEPGSYVQNDYSNKYTFTEMIKFYELWSDVNGTRVDVWSDNPDVLADAYVNGNKAYVIFSNLSFSKQPINLNILGTNGNSVSNVKVKHLHSVNNLPVLDVTTSAGLTDFTLDPEATAIIEYALTNTVSIPETSNESKYYATTYMQPVQANQANTFQINGVTKGSFGEGKLRISFGRADNLSKKPVVLFNGIALNVPDNVAGESQMYRTGFFGSIDIGVPYSVLKDQNTVLVTFPDDGGYISSVTLRNYAFSRKVVRRNSVAAVSVYPSAIEMGIGQNRQLTAALLPVTAIDQRIIWSSSDDKIATVDASGKITGVATGSAKITATTSDGGYKAESNVTVKLARVAVLADSIMVTPVFGDLILNQALKLSYTILPVDVDDKTVVWSSSAIAVATVDNTGLVTAKTDGVADIKAMTANGKFAVCKVTSKTKVAGKVNFDDRDKYLNTNYEVGSNMEIKCNFTCTTGNKVGADGVKIWLREIKPGWAVAKDYSVTDVSVAGQSSGAITANLSLAGVTPTSELDAGNWYFLWISFVENDGTLVVNSQNMYPIKIVKPTGVAYQKAVQVRLFPNPAQHTVFIDGNDMFTEAAFYNALGQVVWSAKVTANTLNVEQLPEGVYFVALTTGHKVVMSKVAIQR